MNTQEAAALLAVAAAYDNRKPDADTATAWALALDGLPFLDCRDVIVAHYRTSTDWIMPAHVRTTVRRLRDKRLAEAGDLTPPGYLATRPSGETAAWLADARRRIADGETVTVDHGELKTRHLPDLREILPTIEGDA